MAKIICPAMEEAGITNPESREGIDFCTDSCPYSKCIVVEGGLDEVYREERKRQMRNLLEQKLPMNEVARRLGVSTRTVQRVLK